MRTWRATKPEYGRCARCGYSRHGIYADLCPECGCNYEESYLRRRQRRWRAVRVFLVGVAVLLSTSWILSELSRHGTVFFMPSSLLMKKIDQGEASIQEEREFVRRVRAGHLPSSVRSQTAAEWPLVAVAKRSTARPRVEHVVEFAIWQDGTVVWIDDNGAYTCFELNERDVERVVSDLKDMLGSHKISDLGAHHPGGTARAAMYLENRRFCTVLLACDAQNSAATINSSCHETLKAAKTVFSKYTALAGPPITTAIARRRVGPPSPLWLRQMFWNDISW